MAGGMTLQEVEAQMAEAKLKTETAKAIHQHQVDALMYGIGGYRTFGRTAGKTATITEKMLRAAGFGSRHLQGRSIDHVSLDEMAKIDWKAMQDAMARITVPKPMVVNKPLNEISNADLVMEMIKRGFAVMKLPEDGGPPEALRGHTDQG